METKSERERSFSEEEEDRNSRVQAQTCELRATGNVNWKCKAVSAMPLLLVGIDKGGVL